MRRVHASGLLVLALALVACRAQMRPRSPVVETMRSQVESLELDGRTYVHDLGQTQSVYVHAVHPVDGDLLLEDIHGLVTYVDGDTLNVRWVYAGLDEPFSAAPTFTPSAVMGISNGTLHVLTRDAGIPDPPPRRVEVIPSAAPVGNDTTIYVPTYPTRVGNKSMYAISVGSGYIGWGWRTREPITSNMAKGGPLGGDTIYFAASDGAVFAFPTHESTEGDPQPAWTAHAYSGIHKHLTVEGDDLGVVTDDHRLICYDRVTGHVRWEAYPAPGEAAGSAAMFVGSFAYYVRNGVLHAFDRATGTAAWTVPGATRAIAERDDAVLVAGPDHTVLKVDAGSGEVLKSVRMPGVVFPTQPVRNGPIHAVSQRGILVGVEYGW